MTTGDGFTPVRCDGVLGSETPSCFADPDNLNRLVMPMRSISFEGLIIRTVRPGLAKPWKGPGSNRMTGRIGRSRARSRIVLRPAPQIAAKSRHHAQSLIPSPLIPHAHNLTPLPLH